LKRALIYSGGLYQELGMLDKATGLLEQALELSSPRDELQVYKVSSKYCADSNDFSNDGHESLNLRYTHPFLIPFLCIFVRCCMYLYVYAKKHFPSAFCTNYQHSAASYIDIHIYI
jgi:hypothetical protein